MKNRLEVLVHALFWVSSAWLITSSFSIQSHEIEVINGIEAVTIVRNNGLVYQLLICILFSLLAFYINVWLIIKRNQPEYTNSSIRYIVLTFIILAALIYAVTEIKLLINTPPIPKQIAFGVAVFYSSISFAYGFVKKSVFNEQRQQQLLIDKKQAELTLLRNQLQPHFLFNALNNLLSMVNRSDNPKLASSFDKLSQLLRFVIEDNKSEKIPISKEINFLVQYIDLQMLRFEEGEVNVLFNVRGKYDGQKVEPGLFIPLIENAFKYGTEPETRSTINIEFDLSQSDSIQFEIKNKMMMASATGIGTGIETTKRRLELIYPDKHKFIISNTDDYIIHLAISTQ